MRKKSRPYRVASRDPALLRERRRALYHPKKLEGGGWKLRGGRKLGAGVNHLTMLLAAFKHATEPEEKEYLFWECAGLLWNQDPDPAEHLCAKHRWSYEIIHELCREKYVAIGGAASSGKSHVFAAWGLVNFLADPANTLILLTSTDLGGARKRVWGSLIKLLMRVPNPPVKIKDSIGVISYYDGQTAYNTSGLQLVTADKNASKMGKLIGIKSPNVILLADELSEMGENVVAAAVGNLSKNPKFQMASASNPGSRFDAFGQFAQPVNGWDSVNTLKDYTWRTKLGGVYLRLSSEDSPNIDQTLSPEYETGHFYPYLPTQEQIDEALANMGGTPEEARKSRGWQRFNSACFFDSDSMENVYSENELIRAGAMRTEAPKKLQGSQLVAGIDPSFSSGGDQSIMTVVDAGWDEFGQHVISHKEIVPLFVDVTNTVDPHELQIADKIKKECEKRGIPVENVGIDATGAGSGLCAILELHWKPGFLRVQFGGQASDRKISGDSKVRAKDRYKNRASELFFAAKMYLLGRQLLGIPQIVATQLCNRTFEMTRGLFGMVSQVEPKKLYKARVGKSPDELDSYLVAVEVCRARLMCLPQPPVAQVAKDNIASWLQNRRTHNDYADDKLGFVGNL